MNDTNRWIKLAREDKEMAGLAYNARLYNQACFHIQQGAEKCLKAYLLEKDGKFPKTHSLTELLMLASLKDESLLSLKEGCLYLDQFYIPTRYPDAPLGGLPEGEPKKRTQKRQWIPGPYHGAHKQ
jgi:HEPN domain-containing protein|tara:strand:- start:74 stop:451 length:378 start_codon:yes stop_codon:yes gene_type:complete